MMNNASAGILRRFSTEPERRDSVVPLPNSRSASHAVIGQSAGWRDVLKQATRVAATHVTVLLQGESGTGKEIVARFIHRTSPQKDMPFIAINCAALPEPLLESELFGYERGAFTGAHQSKPGQFELASAGVLFLDEVSELSLAAQAKFLRVLQERQFQRLGGTRTLKTGARIIAATNRDLRAAMECGAFREDLYYRLCVFDICIPPLRDRSGDIPLLAKAFLEEIANSIDCRTEVVSEEAMAMLMAYHWPGNVRELRNVLERAAILCEGGFITPDHLSLERASPGSQPMAPDLRAIERRAIEQALRDTGWNKAKAARRLGLTRTQLYGRLRKHELEERL
jgi:transcriptional regulator with GAF, ATPase, and Fis domain